MEPSNQPLEYAAPHERSKKQSAWGIASVICWLAHVALWPLCFYLDEKKAFPDPAWFIFVGAALLLPTVGMIAGICGIVQRHRSRKLAVVGLILALLSFLLAPLTILGAFSIGLSD